MRPLSLVRAKGAIPVAGEPIVTRILRQLRRAEIREVVLNLHHLPHTITSIVGDGTELGVRARYSWENPVLGSAGGPRQALGIIGRSPFLIVNGDTLAGIDLGKLIAAHRNSDALVTLAVVPRTEPERYSGIRVSDDGAFTGITKAGVEDDSFHFVGFQMAESDAFADLPAGQPAESVGDLYPRLARIQPGSVRVHICEGEFFDIGTASDYMRTSAAFAAREQVSNTGRDVRIDVAAEVTRSIVWDNVVIEANARLEQCVVTDDVVVPAGSTWTRSLLRRVTGDLAPGEQIVNGLAVARLA